MKSLLCFSLTASFALIHSLPAHAESYAAPVLCKPEDAYILATNESKTTEPFWIQQIGSKPFHEKVLEVEGRQSQVFPLIRAAAASPSAVAIKTRLGASWQFETFCKGETISRKISNAVSPWKTFQNADGVKTAVLSLVNLSQQQNAVEISFFRGDSELGSQSLLLSHDFQRTDVPLVLPESSDRFQVRAQGRWTGAALSESRKELPVQDDIVTLEPTSPARYFLLSSRSNQNRETFVVPLTNPKLIAESLEQIANPQKARILVAKVEKGFFGVNRDIGDKARAPWSWHAEGIQFGDFASIVCDGAPSIVEERLDDWIENTSGVICFWNYRIEKELTEREVLSPLMKPQSSRLVREFPLRRL